MPRLKIKYQSQAIPGSFRSGSIATYIGRTLPRERWLSEHEFMITTGDYDAPIRILDKRNIIEAWIDKANTNDGVYIVDGEKRKYVVTSGPFGRFSCSCTSFGYRKWCSHINEAKGKRK